MDQKTLLLLDDLSNDVLSEILEGIESASAGSTTSYTARQGVKKQVLKQILGDTLGIDSKDKRIGNIVKKIDSFVGGDGDTVTKDNFLDLIYSHLKDKNPDIADTTPFIPLQSGVGAVKFKQNSFSKQSACRLLHSVTLSQIFTVSKDGVITTWSASLTSLKGNLTDEHATVAKRTKVNLRPTTLHVTDSTLMTVPNILVISTVSRELLFYNISSSVYRFQAKIKKMPRVALCLTSSVTECHSSISSSATIILYGDDMGNIVILTFHNPLVSLFNPIKPRIDDDVSEIRLQVVPFPKLSQHSHFVSVKVLSQVHPDWVLRVMYIPHNHSFISCCSNSSRWSLVYKHIEGKRNPYVFNIIKGISCFDYSQELNLLVTGSPDHIIRCWDPCVPSRPTILLINHLSPIVDVLIHNQSKIIFSFSQDMSLCVWSIEGAALLQMVTIKFPFSILPRDFDHKVLSLLSPSLLTISSNEHIAEYKLNARDIADTPTKGTGGRGMIKSHSRPLVAAVFDTRYFQVISGCEGGDIIVWSFITGSKVRHIQNAHEGKDMTCLSITNDSRRTLTGYCNGEINVSSSVWEGIINSLGRKDREGRTKIWDHNTGECLKQAMTPGRSVVIGLEYYLNKRMIFTAGWNRCMLVYSGLTNPNLFNLTREYEVFHCDPHLYKEDVTAMCMDHDTSHIVTGCYDGLIVIWQTETQTPVAMMMSQLDECNSRSLSKSFTVSKVDQKAASRAPKHCPVDAVLFLPKRFKKDKKLHIPALVTSENGRALFWFISTGQVKGSFSLTAADSKDKQSNNVYALCTNSKETMLVAGDSTGYITIFNITNYCMKGKYEDPPSVLASWRAHSERISSVRQFDKSQSLVLSSSLDGTVRLWNTKGHYIGLFGQEQDWTLSKPATFQHPKTPFDDVKTANTTVATTPAKEDGPSLQPSSFPPDIKPAFIKSSNVSLLNDGAAAAPLPFIDQSSMILKSDEVTDNGSSVCSTRDSYESKTYRVGPLLGRPLVSSSSGGSIRQPYSRATLPPLTPLGNLYGEREDRLEARYHGRQDYTEIDVRSINRTSRYCTPYQALKLQTLDDDIIPSLVIDST